MNTLPANLSGGLPTSVALTPDLLMSPSYRVIVLIISILLVIIVLAILRRVLAHASLRGLWLGFMLGMLFIGALGAGLVWSYKNLLDGTRAQYLPSGVRNALGTSQQNLTQVLGAKTQKERPSAQNVMDDFGALSTDEAKMVKDSICTSSGVQTKVQ